MTTCNSTIVRAMTFLLASLSSYVGIVQAVERSATTSISKPGGFITPSARRSPEPYADSDVLWYVDGLCAILKHRAEWNCPPGLRAPASSSDTISAGLAHLRLNIILREMRDVLVAGSGIADHPLLKIKIASAAADASLPEPNSAGYNFILPEPGEIVELGESAFSLFNGIITNGCMGAVASLDLTLDGEVSNDDEPVGEIHLVDAVDGHGYYNFKFTIRASDADGNVSDFTFSGDADSLCTGNPDISK